MTPVRRATVRKGSRSAKPLRLRRRATPRQPRKVRRRLAKRAAKGKAPKKAPGRSAKAPAKRAKARAAPKAAPSRVAAEAAGAGPGAGAPALAPGKLRIALFGAGGTLGSRIAAEAVARGHAVTPVQRTAGFVKLGPRRVGVRRGDAFDADSVASVAKGHDAVVSAVAPPPGQPELLVRAARGLVAGCRAAGVPRLLVVNGAGSLLVPQVDPRLGEAMPLLDTPDFPADWRPTALAHRDALAYLRDAATGLQWTAVSPPALIQPGVRTGRYQIGTERLLRGRDGHSRISAEDYAVAVVDELEKARFKGKRMTVAWP
jgi:putative NADH-flavin reductase